MSFVLKRIETEDSETIPPRVFTGTIRIGSGDDCDLVIDSREVLPFHCELYHRGSEYRFVAANSAFVEINGAEVLKWPAVLQDADVVTIGDAKFRFHILQQIAKRSWKASFSSYLAVFLLAALLIFEVIIMVWLPYKLNHQKTLDLAATIQGIYRTMDELRIKTGNMKINKEGNLESSMKEMLMGCENNMAAYLRRYGARMDWNQARTIRKDLYQLKNIVDSWDKYSGAYSKKLSINPKKYINLLADKLEAKAVKNYKKEESKKILNVNF
ncbi:MAG TPA: FHA domain-containing protein [Victivallales bacterium]|nr:FHA domain-containing protein [Victivallales bacterium]